MSRASRLCDSLTSAANWRTVVTRDATYYNTATTSADQNTAHKLEQAQTHILYCTYT